MSATAANRDRKMVLIFFGFILLVILGVSLLAPRVAQNDPRPTSYNAGPRGAKAAYLTLEGLGRKTLRWTKPLDQLSQLDAQHTTLVLAQPIYDATEKDALAEDVQAFLERGGRVLATGSSGALLLPDGAAKPAATFQPEHCETTPEGPGPLAAAGSVEIEDDGPWAGETPGLRVQQRCGDEAAVVSFAVGAGEAVWWTSASPLSNLGMKHDANLRLLLASIGDHRDVLFDEGLHARTRSMWDAAKGLPLRWLSLQTALIFALLVVSFSRRRGPVRSPVTLPRSSPVEFAESMGDLYERAGATSVATDAARRRLMRALSRDAGLAPATLHAGPESIAESLHERLGGDWSQVAGHLQAANDAARTPLPPRGALALVRALSDDAERVHLTVHPAKTELAPQPQES